MSNDKTRTIEVNYLARVEGEGGLKIHLKDKKVTGVQLNIFEPPRFFEALLRGRKFTEAPDITSRICGICPVAYQMTAVKAMEDALHVATTPTIEHLRRLLYCGEWIESHTLHIYMLHAPDFLGFESAVHMAKKFPKIVERGLRLKKAGNDIMTRLGGREIHPINVRVGGFYRLPTKGELRSHLDEMKWARDAAVETVRWVSGFKFPDWERDYEFVCLKSKKNIYPIEEGTLISNRGLSIEPKDYEKHFAEEHVPHSTALHSKIIERGEYLVGPLARLNLNFDKLSERVREAAKGIKFQIPCLNPFKSIIARSLEVFYACEESVRLIENYEPEGPAFVESLAKESKGYAITEAPRGILYHRYAVDQNGLIQDAKIVPPTSQNQKSIETDLKEYVEKNIKIPRAKLSWQCEQVARNYDPCISCAAHFLDVKWEEE